MDVMSSVSMLAGILVGLIIAVFLLKLLNKNRRAKTEYDERQEQIRGRGYRYAFYTMVIYEAIMLCLSVGGFLNIPVEQYNFHAAGIFIGGIVLCVYTIWNDAYWGRNNDMRRYIVILTVFFALNVFPVIATIRSGIVLVNGYWDFPFVNLFCSIALAILAVTAFIKGRIDKSAEEEDE